MNKSANLWFRNELIPQLQEIILNGGPETKDYPVLNEIVEQIDLGIKNGEIGDHELLDLKREFNDDFLHNTVQGFGLLKPYGYAGDFQIIDYIYTFKKSQKKEFVNWDNYFHQHSAPQAVRNRKDFFVAEISRHLRNRPISLLNVASGPGRDLNEIYEQLESPNNLTTTCVDLDERAIQYAKTVCGNYLQQIEFVHKNILRYKTRKKFDVIWSAGLFDYFNDKAFILALKMFQCWLAPEGEIIVGNFSTYNPSRAYMEIFGEWYLIHRSFDELIRLSKEAGFSASSIRVEKEPLGVNLFLRLRK